MYIINTTFHVSIDSNEPFIEWLRKYYIPQALLSNEFSNPQLARIMANTKEDNGYSYSLQFNAKSMDVIENWYKSTGKTIVSELERLYSGKVAGFSTIMEVLDI